MRQLRILIVDDDAVLSDVLAETLVSMGHVVCGIESTESGAVETAARALPDVLLVDVGLRAGSGVGAVEQIRHSRPVPYIMMSGDPTDPRTIGLQKPFKQADLTRALELALAGPPVSQTGTT